MRKHIPPITISFILIVCVVYVALRAQATNAADIAIDALFAAFRTGGAASAANDLQFLSQSSEDVKVIFSRHKAALQNFPFSTSSPQLNVMLNNTRVEVSWHLSIVFSKRGNQWVPTYFDEFVADPAKA